MALLSRMGFRPAAAVARWIARGICDLRGDLRTQALSRIQSAAGNISAGFSNEQLCRMSFEQIALMYIEALYARRWLSPSRMPEQVELALDSAVPALLRSDRPVIFVSGYIGNPILAGVVASWLAAPLYIVTADQAASTMEGFEQHLHGLGDVRLVPREAARYRIPAVMAEGGRTFATGPAPRDRRNSIPVPFLGQTVMCSPAVAILGVMHGAPIVPCALIRQSHKPRFRFLANAPIEPAGLGHADAVAELTRRYVRQIERIVADHPQQCLWPLL